MTSVNARSPWVEGHISAMEIAARERFMIREGRTDEKNIIYLYFYKFFKLLIDFLQLSYANVTEHPNFLFLTEKGLWCVAAFPFRGLLNANFIIAFLKNNFSSLAESFTLTGRQGVCVVSVEKAASGKSRLDPGCQFGGWAVSGFIFHSATWEAQQTNLPLISQVKRSKCVCVCVWKSFKGCLKHLGRSTGVMTESGADADLSPLIPGLAVQTVETLLMKTLFHCCSHAGQLKQSCQILVFTG